MTLHHDPAPLARADEAARALRAILVHVELSAAAQPRLETAVHLARRLDATLIGVGAEMMSAVGIGDPLGVLGSDWVVELEGLVQDNLKRAEARFRDTAACATREWLAFEAYPTHALAQLARGADLIVAGGAPLDGVESYRQVQTAELVLQAGRPVLVAPPEGGELQGRAVVVAWKDTREARRAVIDALPFLRMAEDVVVQAVCDDERLGDVQAQTFAVVEHLKRHGAPARAKATIAPANRTEIELNITADSIDADLIVAGAYGHSRLGEWVFGGVTRSLLEQPERFVLLSH
jgi:nucleotide-binding universal stress UspA family protein